jgi:hypothetical protein
VEVGCAGIVTTTTLPLVDPAPEVEVLKSMFPDEFVTDDNEQELDPTAVPPEHDPDADGVCRAVTVISVELFPLLSVAVNPDPVGKFILVRAVTEEPLFCMAE